MNAEFTDIGRINFRANARERDPVKLTRKKIAYLGGADKNNSDVTKKYERKIRTAIKGIKKLVFTQHGQKSAQLFTKAGLGPQGLN